MNEMERLRQSFGIGKIELSANPHESKILFSADFKEFDFKTIYILCEINMDFEKFINQPVPMFNAPDKYLKGTRKEFEEFCDTYFITDSDVEKYCIEKNTIL